MHTIEEREEHILQKGAVSLKQMCEFVFTLIMIKVRMVIDKIVFKLWLAVSFGFNDSNTPEYCSISNRSLK